MFAVTSIVSFSSVAHADVPAKPTDQAAQLVQQALQAEANGKPSDRADLLKQALTVAPDCCALAIRRDSLWRQMGLDR